MKLILRKSLSNARNLELKYWPSKQTYQKRTKQVLLSNKQLTNLDILVNNAGIFRAVEISAPELLSVYDEVINTNLRPVIQLTNLAVPYLLETKGNIINISSGASKTLLQSSTFTIYGLSKAALDHFSKGTALELGPKGVLLDCATR
ncbi:unnamed protein product [Chrysodeixis includens]|uniref:Uncharacterized protein n=1 Tax=Chrysodeixis includens TaxID=689277 RepID=A0A9N8L3W5_CHRIL|nr:unnamed protein product [Chrysodeixis includens]